MKPLSYLYRNWHEGKHNPWPYITHTFHLYMDRAYRIVLQRFFCKRSCQAATKASCNRSTEGISRLLVFCKTLSLKHSS